MPALAISKGALTELGSFPAPPQAVKDVQVATLVLLGADVDHTKKYIYTLDYSRHIKRHLKTLGAKCQALDVDKVPLGAALGARSLMAGLNVPLLRSKSSAAACLMEWNEAVIQQVLSNHSQEEIDRSTPFCHLQPDFCKCSNPIPKELLSDV